MNNNSHNSDSSNSGFKNGKYNGEIRVNNASARNKNQKKDDEIDLLHLFHIGWRYKWLLVSTLIIGLLTSYFLAQHATPIYRGDGSIIIAQATNRYSMAGSDISTLLTSSFGIGMGSTIANELQILQSRRFMARVANNILELAEGDTDKYPVTHINYEELGVASLTEEEVSDIITMRLMNGISYERVELESDVVRVTFESPSRVEASRVVNTIIDTYNSFSEYENRRMAREGLNFLERERDDVIKNLKESEVNLKEFMNSEGLVVLDEQSRIMVDMLSELMTERQKTHVLEVTVNAALDSYRSEMESITPGLAEQVARSIAPQLTRFQYQLAEMETNKMLIISENPSLKENPEQEPQLVRLNTQIADLRSQIEEMVNEVIKQDERFIGLVGSSDGDIGAQLGKIRQILLELEIEKKQLEAQIEVLDSNIADLERQFDKMPENMVTMARLQRDMKMNEELFVLLSRQAAEVSIWEQTQLGYGRVVDYSPIPNIPVKPRKLFFLLAGFLLGGIAGLGIVIIRELTKTQITSIETLRDFGYPILTVVPDMNKMIDKQFGGQKKVEFGEHKVCTDLVTLLDPISPFSESYRRLFNNIIYSQPDISYKTLITTSSGQGEGKTTIMCNLGIVMAESDHKVIILDCDFRRPRIHSQFGIDKKPGASDWLFNDIELDDVISQTIVPGLDVITAGKGVKNPANLVQSKRIKVLINLLKERYDYVLIDVPPFGILSDAAPLMSMADGILLISRFNVTRNVDFSVTVENLKNINVPVIGTAITAFDHEKSTDYGYRKDYYKHSYANYNKYVQNEQS